MRAAGHGAIVNISTRQAERASPGLSAYVAAKAGLNGLTRAIAVEEAKHGIRCNTISPGYVLNDRRDADLAPERRTALEGMHLTRLGEAADVAHVRVPREPRVGLRDRRQPATRRWELHRPRPDAGLRPCIRARA